MTFKAVYLTPNAFPHLVPWLESAPILWVLLWLTDWSQRASDTSKSYWGVGTEHDSIHSCDILNVIINWSYRPWTGSSIWSQTSWIHEQDWGSGLHWSLADSMAPWTRQLPWLRRFCFCVSSSMAGTRGSRGVGLWWDTSDLTLPAVMIQHCTCMCAWCAGWRCCNQEDTETWFFKFTSGHESWGLHHEQLQTSQHCNRLWAVFGPFYWDAHDGHEAL